MRKTIAIALFAVIAIGGTKITKPLPAKADPGLEQYRNDYYQTFKTRLYTKELLRQAKNLDRASDDDQDSKKNLVQAYARASRNDSRFMHEQVQANKKYGINYTGILYDKALGRVKARLR